MLSQMQKFENYGVEYGMSITVICLKARNLLHIKKKKCVQGDSGPSQEGGGRGGSFLKGMIFKWGFKKEMARGRRWEIRGRECQAEGVPVWATHGELKTGLELSGLMCLDAEYERRWRGRPQIVCKDQSNRWHSMPLYARHSIKHLHAFFIASLEWKLKLLFALYVNEALRG